jgi:hypothetical protein
VKKKQIQVINKYFWFTVNKCLLVILSEQELLLEVKNGVVVDQGEELNNRIESQLSQIMELESDPSFTLVRLKASTHFIYVCVNVTTGNMCISI